MAIFSKHEAKPLGERIQKARSEGRTQQALELAKQLAKQEPTPEHRELLRSVTFERGCQLLNEGKQRDAIVVFQNALAFEAPPEYRAAVAAKLAQAGDVSSALGLFSQLPDCPERAAAFAQSVDAALAKGAAGRALLPPDLHAGFDAVLNAFALVEKQQDDAAREALQAISLSSPYLEWKVMLRGLIAYYQNDDARALDNWQRLDAARFPWRLAAPFRFQIDASFRAAQPDASRKRLQGLLDRMGNSPLIASLRGFEACLGPWDDDSPIRSAFRLARDFVRIYGASQPHVVARLAQVFYKKVAEDGTEAEVHFYRNAFAAPADDPRLNRLHGLSAERAESLTFAVEGWIRYESDIESLPERFPGATGALARALVWEHLGRLVRMASAVYRLPKEVPPTDQCYRNSIALVPSRLHPYQQLLDELKAAPKKKKQALAAAQSLVAKFPDHAATWEFLGDGLIAGKKPADAIEAYRAALKANPMQSDLRRKLADAMWAKGIKLATPQARAKAGPKPEKYRPTLDEALRFTEASPTARLAQWAILELRHGHADFARELIAKAEAVPHGRIALPLALHAASLFEKKLADEARQEFETRWQKSLEQEANPNEAFAALDVLRHFDSKALRGKKQIVDEVLPELTKKGLEAYSEDQLLKLGQRLMDLKLNPSAKKVAEQAARRYPDNPFVQLLLCDTAMGSAGGNRMRGVNWKARAALEKASKLALALPRELQERALKEIKKREELVKPEDDFRDGLMGFFNRFMDPFGDDDFDDEDLDDDDFGGW